MLMRPNWRDVDEAELASDRAHKGGEEADVLHHIAGKRQLENWHGNHSVYDSNRPS
jgi:hypothetical protein